MPATALKKFGQMGSPRPARKVQNFPEVQTSAAAARAATAVRRIPSVLWSIKEIAAHYGVTTTTVHRWIKAGLLPEPVKSFGSRRWDCDVLISALRSVRKKPTARCR